MTFNFIADASAAKIITAMRGAGKIRHIQVSQVWVQDMVHKSEIMMNNIGTQENLAYALTRHVGQEEVSRQMGGAGQAVVVGSHELAPEASI